MSWFARSLVNTLIGDEENDDDADADAEDAATPLPVAAEHERSRLDSPPGGGEASEEPESPTRGVKEDISELTKTLTRRFWGVASFLAPPPPTSPPAGESEEMPETADPTVVGESDGEGGVESPRTAGIRSDLAEISGKVRSGISMLSNTKAVSEISKIASSFLSFELDEAIDEDGENENEEEPRIEVDAVGVTDDVVIYARNISMHPETWLNFPLVHGNSNFDDFVMSDAQREHAVAIERLAPRLATLRVEFCPTRMSEGCFWKIYFVLLHSRLSNKHDADLLSTPEIVEARAALLQDLPSGERPGSDRPGTEATHIKEDAPAAPSEGNLTAPSVELHTAAQAQITSPREQTFVPHADIETEKYPIETNEMKVVDKSVIEEEPLRQAKSKDLPSESAKVLVPIEQFEEGADDWLEDETGEGGDMTNIEIATGQEEDVSFSDLEDDDDGDNVMKRVELNKGSRGSTGEGNSTILDTTENNDWLDLEDIDVE